MKAIPERQIEVLRAHSYHRTKTRRVQTQDAAVQFVNEMGFCFFWPIQGVELPNLFQAIAGQVRAVPMAHDDPDLSRCWAWKDQALGQRQWFYAKLLCKRATLISLECLPVFYALSPNYGDDEDYLQDYAAGRLSRDAKNIFEVLRDRGPLDTVRLRRECRLAADSAKSGFERALTELQMSMRILPVGVAEAGAWRYAFIYDLVTRHFPEVAEQARAITRSAARLRLVQQYVDNVVAASQADIGRVFRTLKWTPGELAQTLNALVEQQLVIKTPITGLEGEYLLSAKALARLPS
jgi:hypothetical protein